MADKADVKKMCITLRISTLKKTNQCKRRNWGFCHQCEGTCATVLEEDCSVLCHVAFPVFIKFCLYLCYVCVLSLSYCHWLTIIPFE
ncbi:hypothetical protein T10_6331 [Trichinella papuae]|uniref:Uncharacterized protein n=1 Tax=Trichinella papuae TaxID=268474 RepID=A0A0V1MLI9_9BILA|nr:hypothetical protein T10_5936 [Trichinella papuae]KRZ72460.1 hypothetical protein T10_6331 [Trichinella papuae]